MRWLNSVEKDITNEISVTIDFMQVERGNIAILTCISFENVTTLVMVDGVLTNDKKFT